MKSKQLTLLFEESSEGTQDVCYSATYQLGAFKVWIDIRRDFYPNQSHAVAKALSKEGVGAKWELLTSIHYSHMRADRKPVLNSRGYEIAGYEDDVNQLLEQAALILGVKL